MIRPRHLLLLALWYALLAFGYGFTSVTAAAQAEALLAFERLAMAGACGGFAMWFLYLSEKQR